MPSLNLDYMKQYRPCDEFVNINNQTYPVVNGVIVYHWADCGVFTDKDGKEKHLIFIQQCLDDLLDVGNNPSESCDFALLFADFDQMPSFIKGVFAGQDIGELSCSLTRYAQECLIEDLNLDLDIWEIVEKRAAVLDDLYLGRTLEEVLQFRPDIWQPKYEDVIEIANIWKCSLE